MHIVHLQQNLLEAINSCSNVGFSHSWPQSQLCSLFNCWLSADLRVKVQPFVTKLNVWNITRNPSRDSDSRQFNWSSMFPSFGCLMIPRRIIKCQFTNDLNHAYKRHLMIDKKNKVLELEPCRGGAAKCGLISITYHKYILGVHKYILRLEISTFDRENH